MPPQWLLTAMMQAGLDRYATAAREPAGLGWSGAPRLDHVFIIMLENHEADHVIGVHGWVL